MIGDQFIITRTPNTWSTQYTIMTPTPFVWMMFRAPVRGGPFLSSFCQDDEAAASGQQLDVLREGFAERGEAWLRAELEKHNVRELHGVAAAASIVTGATNRAS